MSDRPEDGPTDGSSDESHGGSQGRRHDGSQDGPQDGPEFGWLYGSRGDGSAGDPEPTQMLPTVPRGPGAQRPRSAPQARPHQEPTPSRPVIAPTPPGSSGGSSHGGRRIRVRRIVGAVVLLWLVFLVAVPIWAWRSVDKVNAFPASGRPAAQPGTTYLLVGSDSRAGLSAAQRRQLSTGDAAGARTDSILLLHTGGGPNLLLSIPRDSLVPIPGHGTTKINAAFAYGGPKLLVKTIEQDTGVRVDHYVEVGFGGFVNAVDAVGGVRICPTRNLNDKDSGLHIKKGCQSVNGITALAYSRDRHSFALSDLAPAQHQREVISAIGAKIKSPWTVLDPFRWIAVNKAATGSLKISDGTSPITLAKFGLAMTRINGKSGKTCAMPISDLAVHWDRTRALALMKYIKTNRVGDIPARLCTATGLPR